MQFGLVTFWLRILIWNLPLVWILILKITNKYINHLPSIKETKKTVEVKRDFSPRYESAGELDPEFAYIQVKGQSNADLKAKKPPKFVAQSGKDPKAQRLMAVSFAKLRNFEDALSMADQAFRHIQDILQQN